VAVSIDKKTGEKISTTREGSRGMISPKKTADTYESSTGRKTHRTEMVSKGMFFPKRVAETTRTDQLGGSKTTTWSVVKGLIFRRKVDETDK
jgi:hypothetical protein